MLGLIFFGMAFAWGDFFGSVLYASGSNTTLAGYLYRLTGLSVSAEGITGEALLAARARVPAFSLLVSLPALTLGFFGAASCIRGFKDAQ